MSCIAATIFSCLASTGCLMIGLASAESFSAETSTKQATCNHCFLLPVRIGPFELTQQPVAALDGSIEPSLRGFLAREHQFELILDRVAYQHERSEANPP